MVKLAGDVDTRINESHTQPQTRPSLSDSGIEPASRSQLALRVAATYSFFSSKDKSFTISGKKYPMIDRDFDFLYNDSLAASFGAHRDRDLTLYNPHSPVLESLYEELRRDLHKHNVVDTTRLLNTVAIFVRQLFNSPRNNDIRAVRKNRQSVTLDAAKKVIPLERFIQMRKALCPQHVLVLLDLVKRIALDKTMPLPLLARIYARRQDLIYQGKKMPHYWGELHFENGNLYLIDSTLVDVSAVLAITANCEENSDDPRLVFYQEQISQLRDISQASTLEYSQSSFLN